MSKSITTVKATDLRVGDVIVGSTPGGPVRNTVTSAPRRLGGTGLVAFGLTREDTEAWEGRIKHDSECEVERPLVGVGNLRATPAVPVEDGVLFAVCGCGNTITRTVAGADWFHYQTDTMACPAEYQRTGQVAEDHEHTFLVAMGIEGSTRAEAENRLHLHLGPLLESRGGAVVEWWIAEDERQDGSDCDSAVFVKPGCQVEAVALLRAHGLAH